MPSKRIDATPEQMFRLGKAVLERRDELGLTQPQLAAADGPSTTTVGGIENGTARNVTVRTLEKLDAGLRWAKGSARALLAHGAEPIPIEATPKTELGDTSSLRAALNGETNIYRGPLGTAIEIRKQLDALIDELRELAGK